MLISSQANETGTLTDFLYDAYNFSREFQYIADFAPLQLYASALAFAPEQSIVKMRFNHCMPQWLLRPPEVDKTWNNDLYTLEVHTGYIIAIEFSPNDIFLATCSMDETVRVWDTTDMALFRTFQIPGSTPSAATFSNDNTRIAVAYPAGSKAKKERSVFLRVVVYEIASGKGLRELDNVFTDVDPQRLRLSLALSDDMSLVLVAVFNNTIQAWRAADGFERLWVYELPTLGATISRSWLSSTITICRVAPQLACYDHSGVVGRHSLAVFDLLTGSILSSRLVEDISGHIQYHGKDLVMFKGIMNSNDVLGLLNVHTGDFECFAEWTDPFGWRFALAHGKNRVTICYQSSPQVVEIQSLLTPQEVRNNQEEVYGVTASANGEAIAVRYSYSLTVFSSEGKSVAQRSRLFPRAAYTRLIAISPDGTLFADLDNGGNLWIMDVISSSESEVKANLSRKRQVDEFAFSRDNKQVAIQADGRLLVWNLDHNQEKSSILVSSRNDHDDSSSSQCPLKITSGILGPKDHALDSELEGGIGFEEKREFDGIEPEWIQYRKKDILWIPKRYRTEDYACGAGGNLVALAYDNGSVKIMEFADQISL